MMVNRSVVTMVLMLVTCVIVLVHTKDVTTLEYDDLLPANETNARHRVNTESSIGDHRQGRMPVQAELPSSKAKREQALRSILAARRRQIFSQRQIESRNLNRTSRPFDVSAKDTDVLEAQETRHEMYVTASAAAKQDEETTSRILVSESSSRDVDIEFLSKGVGAEQATEQSSTKWNSNETISSNVKKGDHSIGHRNASSTTSPSTASSQKASDTDVRKKNIVSMPESLYNYFRPVESNIPIEDMSQFLYFGQKIQPETQNTTGNNSVESTPTVPTASSSRRRYSMKRFSGTTPVPVPRLEEIINEEMNIAVERQTVEKNKVSKIKNAFRSAENGVYYRKNRPTSEGTIVSTNVITAREMGNSTEARADNSLDKFRDDNPSAHAEPAVGQLQRERGNAATHVVAETRNATDSTQIPYARPVFASVREHAESEIGVEERPVDTNEPEAVSTTLNRLENARTLTKGNARRRKNDSSFSNESTLATHENPSEFMDAEMHGEETEKKIRRIDANDHPDVSMAVEAQADQALETSSRESNNIEISTSKDKTGRLTTESFRIVPTSPETSTLRIIVTEGSLEESFAIGADVAEKYTVKPVDSTEERVRSVASGHVPTPSSTSASTGASAISSTSALFADEPVLARSKSRHREQKQQQQQLEEGSQAVHEGDQDPHRHQRQEQQQQQQLQQQQQQHVYAYTITNVTRLLRNYTGPGLSREEQGGPERSAGTTEITTGSAQRRQPPPPPLSLLLPRAGSGIEAGRAPAELSAGTTVEPAAAGGSSTAHLVGERQRKVVAAATPQSQQQRAVNRTSLVQLTGVNNKSGTTRSTKPTETSHHQRRGTVRWNHTRVRNTDLEGFNGDRRFLRKSASAVLNQRIGTSPEEDVTSVIGKRRRLTNGQAVSSASRRAKGTSKIGIEESLSKTSNGSGSTGDERNPERKDVEDRTLTEDTISETVTAESVTMQQRVSPVATSFAPSAEETIVSVTPETPANATDEDGVHLTEVVTPPSGNTNVYTKDESVYTGFGSENDSVLHASNGNGASGASGADNATENGSGSPTVTVTATPDQTIVSKETSTTPMSAPVFPVTPRIIAETTRAPLEKETFTTKSSESADTKTTTEMYKLVSRTSNLDPSEIQKMYRSKDATTGATVSFATTEAPTTASASTVQIEISTIPESQSTKLPSSEATHDRSADSTARAVQSATSTDSWTGSGKRVSGERSPEVRGRNLSDKSQGTSSDKDDVLPIMHLYNTSDIFNSTGPTSSFSRGTERRAELPATARTTEKTNDTVATAKSATNEANTTRVPETARRDNNNKQEESRETTTQVPPTGPGRGSTNGSGNNRTRHRPAYHHMILPEYNTSAYPSELNRTFFENELISVSPRESVNISEVISKRHDGDAIASQETVAVVSYILATLVVFPIAVGVGLILRRLILRNRKVLEESDTSSEISCRKDALNLENGDFKTSIEKAITKLPRIQHLVWKAEADDLTGHQGTTRLVAVKTVKEGASEREKEDLVRELKIMQQLGSHPNVVTLLGCCTEQEPHYLILEYVMYGKLLAYLRDHRTRQDFYNFSEDSAALTSRDLTVFGYCVARGMEYLASKKIIHRDLAARNVLVDHNKLCKIADFGMSRFANEDGEVIETRHGRNALPIRWMAPESLIYSLFTTKTDVWSFGILMWEIVTLGSTPYPDMTAREVMRNVQNGYRLERPSHCRSELFRVISRCWHADPDRRPEFQTLRRDLAQLLEDNMNGHYVDLESFASECID
ncbi:hypothetical protein QLX08_008065 [Tetragonisca angustula]|uniref:Protein kinase domain-containing protein n=1 Tax=Tetragonisca angustula TaxID=166442 RepID=A0AAW0ZMP8_9HYME